MSNQTDFANSKNWLNENIVFSFSSFLEPAIGTTDVVNFQFIYKPSIDVADHLQKEREEGVLQLLPGLEMELKAWDKLSDEAFMILENSV